MTTETSLYEYAKQGLMLSGDKPALGFYGSSVSYRQLFAKIDFVADHLYALGVRKGVVVTIHLPNCPQAVIAIYAIAKLGGICNMVHPQVPRLALLENMLFCKSNILITGDHFKEVDLLPSDMLCICAGISDYMGFAFRMAFRLKNKSVKNRAKRFSELEKPSKNCAPYIAPASLAETCVAYLNSSGTTGVPKTVMHSHKTFNNWVHNAQQFFRDESLKEATVLAALPLFHGSGLVLNIHQVLCGGGALVLLANWNVNHATKFIQKHHVTIITGVPYLFHSLLGQKRFLKKGTKYLTHGFVSGDRASLELKEQFDSAVGKRTLFEGYGMTEIVTACFSTSKYNDRIEASGYPLADCFAGVLNEEGSILPNGCGELVVSTNTMMLGYLGETTASCIMEHGGRTWLRTGDFGEIDADGYVYFRERLKNIIIRNGYNIYPDEVEAVIRSLDTVLDVCVLGKAAAGAKGEEVIAFVETKAYSLEAVISHVQAVCNEKLPKYALPNRVVALETFPRNRMKKIDRQALISSL